MRFCPHLCPESIINPFFFCCEKHTIRTWHLLYFTVYIQDRSFTWKSAWKILSLLCLLSKNYVWHHHRHLQTKTASITIKQKFQLAKKKNSYVFHFVTTCLLVCVVNDNIQSNKKIDCLIDVNTALLLIDFIVYTLILLWIYLNNDHVI